MTMLLLQEFGNFSYFNNLSLGVILIYLAFCAYALLIAKGYFYNFLCLMFNLVVAIIILANGDISSVVLVFFVEIIIFMKFYYYYKIRR
jgi:membrane protein required for beta-lactamase induction